MVIDISPELEAKAQRIVERGRYASVEECLVAAIELKLERDRRTEDSLEVEREEMGIPSTPQGD